MSPQTFDGGCQCGALRITAAGPPQTVVCCHCNDCRRWSGAPVTVLAGYAAERVSVAGERPKAYISSPGVRRTFCGSCGTSFSYEDERLPGDVYIAVGVFEEPEKFQPERHSWYSRRVPWLHIDDDLPRHEKSSRPR